MRKKVILINSVSLPFGDTDRTNVDVAVLVLLSKRAVTPLLHVGNAMRSVEGFQQENHSLAHVFQSAQAPAGFYLERKMNNGSLQESMRFSIGLLVHLPGCSRVYFDPNIAVEHLFCFRARAREA